ncbi:MAG: SDR family oxidoreductase [Mycobacterium sp.]
MVSELIGKVAIVTGGASGIGAGIVEKFVAEGARVVIADIERDRGEDFAAKMGVDAIFRSVDVADPEQVGALVSSAVETFGRLDVMVNNAGVSSRMHRSFLDDDLADFQRVMSVNVLGVMAGTREAARQMASSGGGSIINMSSIGGIQAGGGVMTYRASKAAVIMFTKSAAIELAHYEVRVNAIAPGNIPTPLLQTTTTDKSPEELARFEHAIREQMRSDRPLKREGTPDDIAEAALYLAGDRSRYVTGTILPVDGGTVAGKVSRRRTEKKD